MGLLSRLTGNAQPSKKAQDDVLLLLSMMMMVGADGMVEQGEIATIEGYFNTLPEFRGKNFSQIVVDSQKLYNRFGCNPRNAVNALGDIQNDTIRKKCFIIAADIALSSGDIDQKEDELLEAMQRILRIEDDLARKALEVLQLKYQN